MAPTLPPLCEWCGHAHDRSALCARRPRWSRRGFIALFGAGLAGAALVGVDEPVLGVLRRAEIFVPIRWVRTTPGSWAVEFEAQFHELEDLGLVTTLVVQTDFDVASRTDKA